MVPVYFCVVWSRTKEYIGRASQEEVKSGGVRVVVIFGEPTGIVLPTLRHVERTVAAEVMLAMCCGTYGQRGLT